MNINDEKMTNLATYSDLILTKKFQCTKTGFQRCSMQITFAIEVSYHQYKEWNKEKVKTRTTRSRTREYKREMRRRVLAKSMFLLWRFLPDSLYFEWILNIKVIFDPQQEVAMHKNRFPTLRYANNVRNKGTLSIEQRKSENAGETKQMKRGQEAIFEYSNLKSRNAEACFGKVNAFIMAYSAR
ncbi:hypothetical protein T07_12919 [Trichinella nelsoni]|uniref:Uncharacterized protein n=1 Tax=Trichinella nelsoni TaxID=6336 RepID=A0A0V0RZ44_9BILA|nr:hypothetical protein T07_12919 [Trichinella nelsoni]